MVRFVMLMLELVTTLLHPSVADLLPLPRSNILMDFACGEIWHREGPYFETDFDGLTDFACGEIWPCQGPYFGGF